VINGQKWHTSPSTINSVRSATIGTRNFSDLRFHTTAHSGFFTNRFQATRDPFFYRSGFDHHGFHHHRNAFFFGFGAPFGLYGLWWPGLFYDGYCPWYTYGYGACPSVLGYSYQANGYAYNQLPETYVEPVPPQPEPEQTIPESAPRRLGYAQQGEVNFASGNYSAAVRDWRHALVDDPRNPGLVLLLGQALFQTGNYNEAAGAVQNALSVMPRDKWGVVVSNSSQLYGDRIFDYGSRLRDLEAARQKKPDDPALRFLLGYHYTFLGHTAEAVRELDRLTQLAPQDSIARELRDVAVARAKENK
jgi:tetratricopeptide (TPR) repeat protein